MRGAWITMAVSMVMGKRAMAELARSMKANS
jgi:hypothetical protein